MVIKKISFGVASNVAGEYKNKEGYIFYGGLAANTCRYIKYIENIYSTFIIVACRATMLQRLFS